MKQEWQWKQYTRSDDDRYYTVSYFLRVADENGAEVDAARVVYSEGKWSVVLYGIWTGVRFPVMREAQDWAEKALESTGQVAQVFRDYLERIQSDQRACRALRRRALHKACELERRLGNQSGEREKALGLVREIIEILEGQ